MSGYIFNPRSPSLSAPLPSDLLQALVRPPETGRHQWLFRMALRLLWRRSQPEVVTLLRNACDRASRTIDDREFDEAIKNAARIVERSKTGSHNGAILKPKPKWDKVDFGKAHRLIMAWPHSEKSILTSPVPLDPALRHTESVIDAVYPCNPWLSVAHRGSWDFQTARREDLRGLFHLAQLMVPSPMSAPIGASSSASASILRARRCSRTYRAISKCPIISG